MITSGGGQNTVSALLRSELAGLYAVRNCRPVDFVSLFPPTLIGLTPGAGAANPRSQPFTAAFGLYSKALTDMDYDFNSAGLLALDADALLAATLRTGALDSLAAPSSPSRPPPSPPSQASGSSPRPSSCAPGSGPLRRVSDASPDHSLSGRGRRATGPSLSARPGASSSSTRNLRTVGVMFRARGESR